MKKSIGSTFLGFVLLTMLINGCGAIPVLAPPTFTPSPLPTATSTPLPSATPTPITIIIFSTDFDRGVPAQFSGITTTESVQGYAGIGTGTNVFNGNFLRNISAPPSPTTLTLTELPPHTSIDLHFLLAVIDSWDGAGASCCGTDSFTITVDGQPLFEEVFDNSAIGGAQSYIPPPGVEVARMVELGFRDRDATDQESGYDLSLDPTFDNIPHTSSTLTIEWSASGSGWQGKRDESWAIDNLEVILNIENE